jgi:hypothetical protein
VDDCSPVEVDPVEVEPVEVEVLAVAPDEAETVPGIVYALSTPSNPTPATAPNATPAVSRLSIRAAASRARILVSVVPFAMSGSMVLTMARASECFLGETCEFAER